MAWILFKFFKRISFRVLSNPFDRFMSNGEQQKDNTILLLLSNGHYSIVSPKIVPKVP